MADRVEALVLQMSADIRKLETGLAKARQKTNSELGQVERRFDRSAGKIKQTSGAIGNQFSNMTRGVPVFGEALSGLGVAGLAAGTGLLAAGFAAKALFDAGNKARIALDTLATSADNVGTSRETFQALTAEAKRLDVTVQVLEKSMTKLQVGAAEAAFGQGDLFLALKKVNPALLDNIIAAETQEDRWDALNKAITEQDSQMSKVAIARAAFGKQAGQMVRLLDGEQQSVQSLTSKYRDMGLVISEELVRSVAEADERITLANARMEASGTRAAAAMIPVVESLTVAWTNLNIAVGEWFDRWNSPEDQQLSTLQATLEQQERGLEVRINRWKAAEADLARAKAPDTKLSNEAITRKRQYLDRERQLFYEEQALYFETRTLINDKKAVFNKGATSDGTLIDEVALNAAEAAQERAAAELERLRAKAAGILGEIGDTSQLVAAKEKELNELVAAGLLNREQAAEALEKYRESLEKKTAATSDAIEIEKEWQAIIERGRTPVEAAQVAIQDFWAAIADGVAGPPEQAAEVLRVLEKNLEDATAAANAATPAFQAVAEARKAMAEAALGAMSSSGRISVERDRINALVGTDGFSQAEADQSMSDFIDKETEGLRDATRDSVKEGLRQGLSTDDWGGAIRNIIADSIVSGLDTALNALADILTNFFLGTATGGDGGALGAIFSSVGSFFGGARAGGGPVQGGKDYLVGEKGPELLRLGAGQNGQVFNAEQINGMASGAAVGSGTYVDASIRIGGVDMATWPQVQAALARQATEIAARIPGGVNATLADNRRQKRRF